jgi:hypothetical protein
MGLRRSIRRPATCRMTWRTGIFGAALRATTHSESKDQQGQACLDGAAIDAAEADCGRRHDNDEWGREPTPTLTPSPVRIGMDVPLPVTASALLSFSSYGDVLLRRGKARRPQPKILASQLSLLQRKLCRARSHGVPGMDCFARSKSRRYV